jgi:hypothetical protein
VSEEKRFLLRVDPALFRALRKWAGDDFRSVNGQIEFLLRKALREAGRERGGKAREGGSGDDGGAG